MKALHCKFRACLESTDQVLTRYSHPMFYWMDKEISYIPLRDEVDSLETTLLKLYFAYLWGWD